tara:strand:- start:1928 stop:2224 length:297 start_codon:yes stop_codon:yes gene_type:complete
MKHYNSLIVLAIIILVLFQPNLILQLNSTILGKILLLGSLIVATLYQPFIGLLILLLIISLTINREGFDEKEHESEHKPEHEKEEENTLHNLPNTDLS